MANQVNERMSYLRRWLHLPSDDLWDFEPDGLSWLPRKIVGGLRVFQLVWQGYREDECQLHASALTYYTLMSIIPLFALGLALVRVFGGDEIAHARIAAEIARFGQQLAARSPRAIGQDADLVLEFVAQLNQYADWLFGQIAKISFGTLGGIGLVLLIWMAISMLAQVEHSFNRVWNAPARSLWRKCSDYLALVIIVPFLAIAATTIPVANFLSQHLNGWVVSTRMSDGIAYAARQGMPLLLTGVLFVTIFLFIPNTKVRFKPALIGGVLTAIGFLAWLRICTELQVGVIKYSKLYGSFAILPILMAWVYTSWQIVLFGAEVSFACQNTGTYRREPRARNAGVRARWQLALGLVAEMARAMREGTPPIHAVAFAQQHRIPVRLMNDVLEDLQLGGLIAETSRQGGVFVLLRDPATLMAATVIQALLDQGATPESMGLGNLDPRIRAFTVQAEAAWAGGLNTPVTQFAEAASDKPEKDAS
jgi:membrane protein